MPDIALDTGPATIHKSVLLDWLRAGNEILCSDSIDLDYIADLCARTRKLLEVPSDHP